MPELAAPPDRVEVARGTDGRPVLLPRSIVMATAWAWRLALITIVLYGIGFLVLGSTQAVTTPLLIAVLLAALLHPLYRWVRRARLPRLLAAVVTVLVLVVVVLGALFFVGEQFAVGIADVGGQAQTA